MMDTHNDCIQTRGLNAKTESQAHFSEQALNPYTRARPDLTPTTTSRFRCKIKTKDHHHIVAFDTRDVLNKHAAGN